MEKLLLLVLLFVIGITNAQIVNIPDANFKAALIDLGVDTNNDSEIQESEASAITFLSVYNQNISDLTGISSFVNLTYLGCSRNQLTSLDVRGLESLLELDCSGNLLTSLDFNKGMRVLYCSNNQLTSIDISQNVNLTLFACSDNSLMNIDVFQNTNLIYLWVEKNLLTTLDVTQNTNILRLGFDSNSLRSINLSQNNNLVILGCSENLLTSLDLSLNPYITRLNCYSNQLTNLDLSNQNNLEVLNCNNNPLESLDVRQNINLGHIICNDNQLEELDVSQNLSLERLFVQNNQLTTIDLSQNSNISYIRAENNQLIDINIKNGVSEIVYFPKNTTLQFICADEEQIISVQSHVGSNVVVSSYCSFAPGGNYNTISGSVLFDSENNGCDVSDLVAINVRIDINDGVDQGTTFVNTFGEYNFYTQAGNFTLTPNIENSAWFNVLPVTANISFADNNNNTETQDFCVTANGVHNDVEIVIVPIGAAQPGFDALYQIVYNNKGNQTLSGDINFMFDDTVLDYVSASISPYSQTTGNLSWSYTDLRPFESSSFYVTINVNAPTETPPVNIGDELGFNATINPIAGDGTPTDNAFELTQTVVGSYDQNDKTCLEGETVVPEQIGDYLHYNINFENTGIAAATFLVVKDVIDETKFDINTLQVMYASHDMVTTITGNNVEFVFDNINLGPDEKGNVLFKIKTLNTLTVGDKVSNMADIYFDYNFPIETNEANTSFQVLSVDEFQIDNSVSVFPNPIKDLVTVKANAIIKSIEIYDVQGRVVLTKLKSDRETTINMSSLASGIYFFKIKTDLGEKVEKIIKD